VWRRYSSQGDAEHSPAPEGRGVVAAKERGRPWPPDQFVDDEVISGGGRKSCRESDPWQHSRRGGDHEPHVNRPEFRAYFLTWKDGTFMPVRYDQDTKAKAIRLVREHAGDYPSEYAAITAVAGRLGMSAETLRKWIRQAAVDEGQAPGVSSEAEKQIRELKRKVNELERTIEILTAATSFFAREHDPLRR